jgi:NADH:ubiquinone oxidoreductase subunit F (NADH-binding)
MTTTNMASPVTTGPGRLLPAAAADLAAHRQRNGQLPRYGPGRLLAVVRESGLSGRGGAGFPTWRKLAAVAGAAGEPGHGDRTDRVNQAGHGAPTRHDARVGRPIVVANGAEGEPASAKDRTLMINAPHLVLDGLQLAAEAVGAEHAYVYVATGPAVDAVRGAIAQRRAAGWDHTRTEVVEAPHWFVAGEESAVVAGVEGRDPLPRDKTRRVVEAGVRGQPTLVQNVETLAQLALIARHGAAWFRTLGTAGEPGTFLATVRGAVAAPGVYEVPLGVPIGELITLAGGASAPLRAFLVGGYHGSWLPATAADVRLSRAGLRPLGAAPGVGVVVALPSSSCGLKETARIASYLAGQSARQCGPCLNGLPRLAGTLERLAHGDRVPGLVDEVMRLAAVVEGRGACHHPDGAARFIRSSLHTFADEVTLHRDGRCGVAGVGRETR